MVLPAAGGLRPRSLFFGIRVRLQGAVLPSGTSMPVPLPRTWWLLLLSQSISSREHVGQATVESL